MGYLEDLLPFILTAVLTILAAMGIGWRVFVQKGIQVLKEFLDIFLVFMEKTADGEFSQADFQAVKAEVMEFIDSVKSFKDLSKGLGNVKRAIGKMQAQSSKKK